MQNFIRNFLTEWRKLSLSFDDETFVAAVSGGADSVALLLALDELRTKKKLKNRFVVAHFNHNLRGKESAKDAEFVGNLASEFDFEFVCKTTDGKSQKGNLEQNARNARYDFLRETAANYKAYGVLTAHTLNDQAETFLLNLIRGSGIEGLGGMKPKRILEKEKRRKGEEEILSGVSNFSSSPLLPVSSSQILLVRPLLNWAKREDTENFCRLKNIKFRYDSMNDDQTFSRVRIRKTLLPMLARFNPKIVETLAKTGSMLAEDFAELQKIAEEKTFQIEDHGVINELLLKEIKDLLPSSRLRILRQWLKNNRGDLRRLEAKHFEAIEKLIFSKKSGKTIELPKMELIIKKNGKLIFTKSLTSNNESNL